MLFKFEFEEKMFLKKRGKGQHYYPNKNQLPFKMKFIVLSYKKTKWNTNKK